MKRVQYTRNPWTLEQGWSPSSRAAALTSRDEAPYLMRVVNGPSTGLGSAGRAVILDYGIRQADGTWKLASDPAVTYATAADIKALPHATGSGQGFNLRNYEVDLATLDGVRAGDAGGIGSAVAGQPVTVTYSDGSTGVSRVYESKPAPAKAGVKTMIALLQRTRARTSGGCPRAGAMEHRRAAAVNDNDAWRGAAFTFNADGGRIAA